MDDDQKPKPGMEDEDESAEVVDIDNRAAQSGLHSGTQTAKGPAELNTTGDLKVDEQKEWES